MHANVVKEMGEVSNTLITTIPVAFKTVRTAIGVCYFMSTKLSGTTERKHQGNNVLDYI